MRFFTPIRILAAILIIGMLLILNNSSVTADTGVTIEGDGTLTINTDEPYTIVHCSSEQVAINGTILIGNHYLCGAIGAIVVQGGAGNNIMDLSAVTPTNFPNVASVSANGGAGNDQITASDFNDVLLGGPGNDGFVGADPTDIVDGGIGQTFFMEETEPLTVHRADIGNSLPDVTPFAPPLGTTIEGLDFDQNGNTGLTRFIPPDPIAAAGPNHVVSVDNVSIEWYTKAGVQQNSQSLQAFFGPVTPVNFTYDPKVIYDQYEDRFVVVTLELQDSELPEPNPGNTSRILVAVSDDSDPNGNWYFHSINSKVTIGGIGRWADYPGFAVDSQAVYITSNMFAFSGDGGGFGGVRLWIIDKGVVGGFYAGAAATVTVHDPIPGGFFAITTQPAHMFGTVPGNIGTFIVSYSGLTGGATEFVQVIRLDDPLGAPAFTGQFVSMGNIENAAAAMPDAPQSGTATLVETNDRRALHAVWRDDSLWMATTIVAPAGADAGQATAHWVQMNTFTPATISLADQGNVGAEDIAAGTYTSFPSIAVDPCGNMAIGFAGSAATIFPSALYTGRVPTDAPGTVQSTGTLAAGTDYYVRTFGGPRNRWGDYSGIELDPADEAAFWVYNEYAITRGTPIGGEDGRWGTRFGSFVFNDSGFDFGDLPPAYNITNYRTVAERPDDGARHCITSLMLGSTIDADADGQESVDATGDGADEDGVSRGGGSGLGGNWADGANGGSVNVTVSGGNGCLSGWIDWDEDNSMATPGDQVINNQFISAGGPTNIPFTVPAGTFDGTLPNNILNARFRLVPDRDGDGSCADQTAVSFTGSAPGGEVEDYQWEFTPTAITLQSTTIRERAEMLPVIALAFLLLILTSWLLRKTYSE